MTHGVSLLLVDDHSLVRQSLAERLGREPDLHIVGTAGNAEEAIRSAIELQPDVILMDIDMPGILCFDAARTIAMRCPETRVIFVTAFRNDRYIEEALAVESTAGYVTKDEPPEILIGAIRQVARGGTFFSEEVQSRLVVDTSGPRLGQSKRTRSATLTPRELEVLRYIARGLSQKQIAETMRLAPKTVNFYSTSVMAKLDIHDRVELARFAIREGLAEA